ncbi:ImmA/IrrE family metallo-endopeptidase [Oceanicoccus sp. KOV_DT_Chl]|uniref:ImmA/IrrE family metallo-endopeptidase n=1 Tax=Oceanicoccus sp. KOV_DT_Chl TaxID=1904639 RepID=UPI001358C956|nr:ImmA/IrrE family metallo-endopeptidase [Oceanicoccus sp. KOV_DT_Chl]
MNIKVIKSETDYKEALNALEQLMSNELSEGTKEFEDLEVLSVLIEKYESENVDLGPVDPIEAIKFRMEQGNLKNRDLAPYIGSVGKVSEVLNRKRPLSLNMIRGLHKGLGVPYTSLMEEPQKAEEDLGINWLEFPLKEMFSRKLFTKPSLLEVKNYAEEEVIRFFGPHFKTMKPAFLRATVRSGRQMNGYALSVWHVLSLKKAEEKPNKVIFDPEFLDDGFFESLLGLSFLNEGPSLAVEYLEKFGISLVFNEHFSKTYLDGAALLLDDGSPVISMTLRHNRLDNFWFVLMHELAHIKLHLFDSETRAIYDDLDSSAVNKIEEEADEFAMKWLLPAEEKEEILSYTTAAELKRAAKKFNKGVAILAGALRKERNNYRIFNQLIGSGTVREMLM